MGVQNNRVSLILRWRTEWSLQATMIQKSFMNSAGRKKFQSLKTNLTEATLSFSKMNLKFKKIAKKWVWSQSCKTVKVWDKWWVACIVGHLWDVNWRKWIWYWGHSKVHNYCSYWQIWYCWAGNPMATAYFEL